jgi:tetratricopeptide (TPR) repeat protein
MSAILLAFYERMGIGAYSSGKLDKAESWFRRMEKEEPDSLRVLRNLGAVLLAKGRSEEAEAYLRKEEKRFGESYRRHCAIADLAYAAGRRGEALSRYRAALAEPESAKDRKILEARFAICSDTAAYRRAKEAQLAFAQGDRAREAGETDAAISAYEKAFSLDPSSWPALNNAGTLLMNVRKDYAAALKLFQRALDLVQQPHVARNAELAAAALARRGDSA